MFICLCAFFKHLYRAGDKPPHFHVDCPQNGTVALGWLTEVEHVFFKRCRARPERGKRSHFLVRQSGFGDKSLGIGRVCPKNGAAVVKGSGDVPGMY